MALIFECDFCWDRREISIACGDDPHELFAQCSECGQEGCIGCMPDNICEDCRVIREINEDLDDADA